MARATPLVARRPSRPIVHKQLTDGVNVADIYLKANDMPATVKALEIATANTELFITGNKDKQPPVEIHPFPPIGGEAVTGLSEMLFNIVAQIYVMQQTEDEDFNPYPDEIYTFVELVGMTITMPKLWGLLTEFAAEVRSAYEESLPNACAGGKDKTSAYPSATSTLIQSISSDPTPLDSPLMSVS